MNFEKFSCFIVRDFSHDFQVTNLVFKSAKIKSDPNNAGTKLVDIFPNIGRLMLEYVMKDRNQNPAA